MVKLENEIGKAKMNVSASDLDKFSSVLGKTNLTIGLESKQVSKTTINSSV